MRTVGVLASLLVLASVVSAQEGDGLTEEADEAVLENELADRDLPQVASARWRLKGPGPTADRLNLYQRLTWQRADGLEICLLTERDPGEPGWADFSAGYATLTPAERPLSVTLGDLRPGWASGLVFGRAAGPGGALLAHPSRDGEVVGYRSSGENQALRGMALRWQLRRLRAALIAGQARRDARLDVAGQATSLPESGYHVTATERDGEDKLAVKVAGGRIAVDLGGWRAGMSLQNLRFSRRVDLRRPGRVPWAFHGTTVSLAAVDLDGRAGPLELRAETALSGRGWAGVAGARLRLRSVRGRVLVRRYDPEYYSPFGGAVSRAGMANEEGLLLALEGRGWTLFADRYHRPRRTYYYPEPATLEARGASVERRLPRGVRLQVRYQEEHQPRWQSGQAVAEHGRRLVLDLERGRGRGSLARVRLRVAARRVGLEDVPARNGALAALLWQGIWPGVTVALHGTRYRTDGYAARLYEAEYDLPGAVSIRPLYENGWRVYGLVTAARGPVSVSLRYRLQVDRERQQYLGLQLELQSGRPAKSRGRGAS